MKIELFDYQLPDELIAQFPNRNRDESRLMVVDRKLNAKKIVPFKTILDYFCQGDALVVNNTKVFKARLLGHRISGAKVEIFLVRNLSRKSEEVWLALARPSKKLRELEKITFGKFTVQLMKYLKQGRWEVKFSSSKSKQKIIEQYGHIPLPQYIKTDDEAVDIERYQTIFAKDKNDAAVAAPTAGFHFTHKLIDSLKEKGVKIVELTLNVGPGTFKPVEVDNISDHIVDPEFAELSEKAAETINAVKKNGNKIFAVGTTTCRTLESAAMKSGNLLPFSGECSLYIKPGYKFNVVDHLITNFHLPKSSLLILVSAFHDRKHILDSYKLAIENRMMFYSYGDAMLLL